MYQVEIYGRVRRAVLVEGRSQRSVAREFGLAHVTVRKMVSYSMPPGYRRREPPKRPKLGPWVGVIDAILEEDKQRPAKQRHTAKRIFDRLRAEHSFPGGYTIVKDYVRAATLRGREMFIPLTHTPGTAQADFGDALVIVAGGAAGILWASGHVLHPFTPVVALLLFFVGTSSFGKVSAYVEKMRPLVGKNVRVRVWGSELPGHADSKFSVHAVQAIGPGLHV
jgi:hypothetical protein